MQESAPSEPVTWRMHNDGCAPGTKNCMSVVSCETTKKQEWSVRRVSEIAVTAILTQGQAIEGTLSSGCGAADTIGLVSRLLAGSSSRHFLASFLHAP